MKKIHLHTILTLLLIMVSKDLIAQFAVTDLQELAVIRDDVKSKRVSSFDHSGGNADGGQQIMNGETRVLFDVKGAGMINHIWITIGPPTPGVINRNDIILRIYWDGSDIPSVVSPIGPFFGQGWDECYDFSSLPLSAGPVEGRGLVCYFVMPFAKGAKIEVENQTGRILEAFYYYVDYTEMRSLPEKMGRFHAWYNHDLTEARENGDNDIGVLDQQGNYPEGTGNYLIADIKGKGHFVGVNYYVHSPTPMWYGEGDDMIFIDGDPLPTLHGTGTEDYFNMAYCPRTMFKHPYYGFGRVNEEEGWLGRTHLYRFHINDPIYFDKSLKFTIEHGHNNDMTLDISSVAYWYQIPPFNELPPLPDKEARKPKPFINHADIHKWRDAWRKAKGNDSKLWGNE
jgi:hypothetical protein